MKSPLVWLLRGAASLSFLAAGVRSAKAELLGYWNFDGPATATASDRLKDLSGKNYHGNDRNAADPATRVLFNNRDIPAAPFLIPQGNTNYCLDLSGADRYVVMEGATGIAAAGAVTTAGNAFNIGNSSSTISATTNKLTVAFWFKGLPNVIWGDCVAKGGESYPSRGVQGWSVRRFSSGSDASFHRFCFTTRGIGGGDFDSGFQYADRSGGTLAAPTVYDPTTRTDITPTGIYSDNLASGMWQHVVCVWDGTWLHHYVNGFQVRSTQVAANQTYIGTTALLSFGVNMMADTNVPFTTQTRFSRVRLDDIAIWDEALLPAQIEDVARGADPRQTLRTTLRPFDFAFPAPSPGPQYAAGVPTCVSFSPTKEAVANILDATSSTKWLSYAGRGSGFIVTPAASSSVQSFIITTANDGPTRDPISYELYGTNDPIASLNNSDGKAESWTSISTGSLALPAGRQTIGSPVNVTNGNAYTSYKMVFPQVAGATEVLFQIADIQFYAAAGGTGGTILAASNAIKAIAPNVMPLNSAGAVAAGYTGGAIIPQGTPGGMGIFEMRNNGGLKRYDGTTTGTNGIVYANESPILYARWGVATNPSGTFGVAPFPFVRATNATVIDYGDAPGSVGTGFNGIQTEYPLSTLTASEDAYFHWAQGCFRVPAAGRYTFTMRGDDGSQLAIFGATWVNRYSDNGNGSYIGEMMQNGFPTGDTNDIAVVEFPAAGDYNFRYMFNEQGGGAFNEVLYAPGEKAGYDSSFVQVGDPAGGLTLVDHVPIADLKASASFIQAGLPSSVTLKWDAAYATSVTLNGGTFANQNVTASTINGFGSVTIPSPSATTTYTLTAVRNSGAPVVKSVTIYVNSPPVLQSFTADDATLLPGATLVLRWVGLSGVTYTLNNGVTNTNVTANTTTAADGVQTGTITLTAPAADTTYSLTATNINGTSTPVTLFVDIGTPPTISITANPTTAVKGQPVTLSWSVSGDSLSQTITPRLTSASLSTNVPQTGSQLVYPELTRTWTLTATNIYGAGSSSATVTMPERIGVDASKWTVQVDYWNRFGYNDPVYGNRTAINSGLYQADEMYAVADSDVGPGGINGPLANPPTQISPGVAGPNPAPNAQPGTNYKLLMRYRQTGVTNPNYSDAGTAAGFVAGDTRPPPIVTTNVTYDQFSIRATANLVVNVPGVYSLGVNSDDGVRLRMDVNKDGDFTDVGETLIIDETPHGFFTNPVLTTAINLEPGSYPIEVTQFEATGGAGVEVFFIDAADNNAIKALPIINTPLAGGSTTDVVISEFLASNASGIRDLEGTRNDWIELYNGSNAAISLNGYYLSDLSTTANKWAFPAGATIPAKGYLLVYASGKFGRTPPPPASELHTNFSLSATAGYIGLSKNDGAGGFTVLSSFTYGRQRADVSFGTLSGGGTGYMPFSTPNWTNVGGVAGLVIGDTKFSVKRGIYSTPVSLALTADDVDPATFIRYTLDGSTPSESNGETYSAPIIISTTTVVRAAAFRANAIPTNVDTQTYIFPVSVLSQNTVSAVAKGWPNQSTAGQYFDFEMDSAIVAGHEAEVITALKSIPTVSMVTDITNLTDPASGIFVESQLRGRATEKNVSIELINDTGTVPDASGTLGGNFQIDAGVRSRGGFSRNDGNPKHSWHLYFRNDYDGDLEYPVYGADGASSFEQLDLATANNYSWSYAPEAANIRTFSYTNTSGVASTYTWRFNTMIRDLVGRDLQRDMNGLGTRNKYVHLYINGQYWGINYIQERPESSFSSNYLGGDKDNYDVIKSAGNANTSATYRTEATDGTYTGGIVGTASADGIYVSPWSKLWGGSLDLRQRNGVLISQAAIDDRNVRFYKLLGYDYNPATKTTTRNLTYPVVLDANQLIDYMLIAWYCGAYDAPLSTFLGNAGTNNWWAIRDSAGTRGFSYFAWDFEHGMGSDMLSGDMATGVAYDIDYGPGSVTPFVFTTAAPPNSFRSTNRLGPWGGAQFSPPAIFPSYTAYRGAYSATNPEYYQSFAMYNVLTDYTKSNPEFVHENLAFATEYRRMFADCAQAMLRQNGPLITSRAIARINDRANQLSPAIIAESARWGNAKGVTLANYNKPAWEGAVQNMRDWVTHGSNQHVLNSLSIQGLAGTGVNGPGRAELLISQLRNYHDGTLAVQNYNINSGPYWVIDGLFPNLDAPVLGNWGGTVATGYGLTVTNPNGAGATGTIYYTLDGSDPRPLGGGAPAVGALTVANGGTITLSATATVRARVYNASASVDQQWSAAATADFVVGIPASASNLVITEIHYNPLASTPTGSDGGNYEFVELQNVSAGAIDLAGVNFSVGITYTFPVGSSLAAGARVVIVKDLAAFASRYPDSSYAGLSAKTVGPFTGALDNAGERLTLKAANGDFISNFVYDDADPWPKQPDGSGPSLFFTTASASTADANNGANWFSHATVGGNPGGPDAGSYSAWATLNGGSANGDVDTGDQDGLSDLLEYFFGGSMTASSNQLLPSGSVMSLTVNAVPGNYQVLSFTRAKGTEDVAFQVQVSDDLGVGSWSNTAVLVSRITNVDGSNSYVYRSPVPISSDNREFMRVQVNRAP